MANADVILVMGSNVAENHPVGFRWVAKAQQRGAKLISVDPRFTRTSAKADLYAPLRAGSDIAFLGGLIRYILEQKKFHADYVVAHTNATFLIDPRFGFSDGVFTGYEPERRGYDKKTWAYQTDGRGVARRDETLRDERCVFRLLEKHFERYDVDTVSAITGTPRARLLEVYEAFASTGRPDQAGTILYAMGWTQHTHGTQNIRAAAIVQLLLGNVGRPGGGVNALRGESNVQGSTDHAILFHLLPGYLKAPRAGQENLEAYLAACTPHSPDPQSADWWQHYPKYAVSFLKWMYGDRARSENGFLFDHLPKAADHEDYSWLSMFRAMGAGAIRGLFAWGQNPAVGGAGAGHTRQALERLDWLVAVNLWDVETSSFWNRPGADPASISTEVFLLPCAASVEKEGSITNSGRWAQWRWKAVEPPGEARADAWILNQLMVRLRRLYRDDPGPNPAPVLDVSWDYGDGENEVDVHRVAREVNGWSISDGRQVASFTGLRADGSTACANWLYAGSYTEAGNGMARRDNRDTHPQGLGLFSNWAWCWPVNRRILYNRAGCDRSGAPFEPARYAIRWDAAAGRWQGDVPDGGWPPGARHAFIMLPEGYARIFGAGRADGPFPAHYEPWESPVANLLYPETKGNPACAIPERERRARGDPARYPIVATTHRLSEHWQSGAMTRNNPWLAEVQPDMFVELSPELAESRGIANGELVVIESVRASIRAVALVTRRLKPLRISGRTVHQIGLPWHWGYRGLVTGESANLLTPPVGDPNTLIPETKAFLCNVRRAREGGAA